MKTTQANCVSLAQEVLALSKLYGEMDDGDPRLDHRADDWFAMYEKTGFEPVFHARYDQHSKRNGMPFQVIGRVPYTEVDAEVLPMWRIRFADGLTTQAWPEEITCIENSMRAAIMAAH